jgi:TonB-linked SusC/RagA family outer membrane protein
MGVVQTVHAQDGTVTGRVTAQTSGLGLSAATIQLVGTNRTARAARDGTYTIRVPAGVATLRVIAVGYASVETTIQVAAGQATTLDFSLAQIRFTLEEIVVTATGEQARREIGNAVTQLNVADLTEVAPITNFQDVLNSRAPGVVVLPGNGTVGNGARIRIRGFSSASLSNDPLIYIDGVRVESGSPNSTLNMGGGKASFFDEINPEDIERIEIVKGPSASTLYGTQAANGVIRITTKRGREGPAQWNAYVEQGFTNDVADYPDVAFSRAVGGSQCLPWQQAEGLCTIDQLFTHNLMTQEGFSPLKTGYRQQYGVNVTGGTEAVQYFVSAEWLNEDGTIRMPDTEQAVLREERGIDEVPHEQRNPNELTRSSLRANIDARLGENADLSFSSAFTSSNIRFPVTGNQVQSVYVAALNGSADPDAPSMWGFSPPNESMAHNVIRLNDRFISSATVSLRPTTFLNLRGTTGIDYLDYSDNETILTGQGCRLCGDRIGKRSINRFNKSIWYTEAVGSANYDLGDRVTLKTSLGFQFTKELLVAALNSGETFPPGGRTINAAATRTSSELTTETVTIGTFVEQRVGFDDRLFLTGALRYDQNSTFGSADRSALYPKAAISFVVLEDRGSGFMNLFRVRGALGWSGLQPGANAALQFFNPVTATTAFGDVATVTLGGLGNDLLKPERSREIELGFDLSLVGSRVDFQGTYYKKNTTDALINRPLPGSLGATATRTENLGEVSNEGVELQLNALVVDGQNFSWDVGISVWGNKNRLVELGEGVPPVTGFNFQNREGLPLFSLFERALLSYEDTNGDGIITPSEIVVSDTVVSGGSPAPVRGATFNTSINLFSNRVQISGLADYRGGFNSLNVNDLFQCAFTQNCTQLNAPSPSLEDQAKAVAGPQAPGSYFEKADFLRIREASIAFELPRRWAQAVRANHLRLTITGRNLATITSFGSWDPELNTVSNDAGVFNFGVAGLPRTFLFRLNVGF